MTFKYMVGDIVTCKTRSPVGIQEENYAIILDRVIVKQEWIEGAEYLVYLQKQIRRYSASNVNSYWTINDGLSEGIGYKTHLGEFQIEKLIYRATNKKYRTQTSSYK